MSKQKASIYCFGFLSLSIATTAFAANEPIAITPVTPFPTKAVVIGNSASATYRVGLRDTHSASSLTVSKINFSTSSADVSLDHQASNACKDGSVISASKTCDLTLNFTPSSAHTVTGSLSISAGPFASNLQSFSVSAIKKPTPPPPPTQHFTKGSKIYVGTNGILARVPTSGGGENWYVGKNSQDQSLAGMHFNQVSYGVNNAGTEIAIAIGSDGKIYHSLNGIEWLADTSHTTNDLTGISYGNNIWVAVGKNGSLLYSQDGKTWQSSSHPKATTNLNDVTFVNNKSTGAVFIAVGDAGYIIFSNDGKSWSQVDNPYYHDSFSRLVNINNTAYALGTAIYRSGDGKTWLIQSGQDAQYDTYQSLVYGRSTYEINDNPVTPYDAYIGLASNHVAFSQQADNSEPPSLIPWEENFMPTSQQLDQVINTTQIIDEAVMGIHLKGVIDTALGFTHGADSQTASCSIVSTALGTQTIKGTVINGIFTWNQTLPIHFSFPNCVVKNNQAQNVSPFFRYTSKQDSRLQDIEIFYQHYLLHGTGIKNWQVTDLSKLLPAQQIPMPIKAVAVVP